MSVYNISVNDCQGNKDEKNYLLNCSAVGLKIFKVTVKSGAA